MGGPTNGRARHGCLSRLSLLRRLPVRQSQLSRKFSYDNRCRRRIFRTALDDLGTLLIITIYLLPQFRGTRVITFRLLLIKTRQHVNCMIFNTV